VAEGRLVPNKTLSFIVRIWHEESNGEGGIPVRRGSIEHVSTGRRIYFEDMQDILLFIEEETATGREV
jgi:hypothetical protein